jgi:hypothetical protein
MRGSTPAGGERGPDRPRSGDASPTLSAEQIALLAVDAALEAAVVKTDRVAPTGRRPQRHCGTRRNLSASALRSPPWAALGRPPAPLETSVPGVLAAGDVRSGSIKRVAAAVGDGATASRLVRERLIPTA